MRTVIALLLLAGMIGGCDRQSQPEQQADRTASTPANDAAPAALGKLDRSHAGEAAPTIAFQAPDGRTVTLADFRGKPLLLNLWATWCAPCVKEMPTLDALAVREGDALQVLVLSQDFEGAEKVKPFFDKAKFARLQPYLDTEAGFSLGMGLNLPTTILYDGEGREVWRMSGDTDWAGQPAAKLIAEAR